MTSNNARKEQARAIQKATGMPYAAALRQANEQDPAKPDLPDFADRMGEVPPGAILCADLHDRLAAAITKAGWTNSNEGLHEGTYTQYPALSNLYVSRTHDGGSHFHGLDPDDPYEFDLATPPEVVFTTPFIEEDATPAVGEVTIPGHLPTEEILKKVERTLRSTRAESIRRSHLNAECVICGSSYPERHLIEILYEKGRAPYRTCPACVFDPDIARFNPAVISYFINELLLTDTGAPAGWSAVVALLTTLARDGERTIKDLWVERGITLSEPGAMWSDPAATWIWLPPKTVRPKSLRRFGAGAPLAKIVEALEAEFPNLQADTERYATEDEEEPGRQWIEPLPELWPVTVAYAIAFTTEAHERHPERSPWHVTGSLEEGSLEYLANWFENDWDGLQMQVMLEACEHVARAIFSRIDPSEKEF